MSAVWVGLGIVCVLVFSREWLLRECNGIQGGWDVYLGLMLKESVHAVHGTESVIGLGREVSLCGRALLQ